jgi:hypothetical protein
VSLDYGTRGPDRLFFDRASYTAWLKSDDPEMRFLGWSMLDQPRYSREWERWDGTVEHAERIVDASCERADAARVRLNCPLPDSRPA